jgi:SRSO17 transposase
LIYPFIPAINCTCELSDQSTTGAKDLSIFGAMAKATHTDYQKFQYFFSDSKWDIQAIKLTRLEIIQKQRTTASTKDGLLAIDDTGCPKPFAKKTEGAKWQYCGPLKREEVCNVGVGAVFVSQAKHFPIDIIPYLPASEFPRGKNNSQFKDKIQIAIELFDTYSESIDFSGTVFDSWYAAARFLKHIHGKGKLFYSEMKSNRNIFTLLDKNAYICLSDLSNHLTG